MERRFRIAAAAVAVYVAFSVCSPVLGEELSVCGLQAGATHEFTFEIKYMQSSGEPSNPEIHSVSFCCFVDAIGPVQIATVVVAFFWIFAF